MATTLYRTLTGQSQKSEKSHRSEAPSHTSSAKPAAPLQKTTTTDPYSGVLNHLTEPQIQKLVDFKERLEKDGWWSPDGINGKPTHDDGTLLRYLRARKFDVEGAYGQFTETEKWLKEQHVEELYENFDVEHYERARLMYPQWTGRRDKRGIPIYLFNIKHLDSKAVSKYQKEAQKYKDALPNHKKLQTPAKLLPLFALYHNLLNFVLPFVSTLERPNPEIPITNSTNIVDIQGVGLTQFWNLKNHMQDASVLATAHYPETLDRIFIIGAPAFFPTVWSWIKRWFDPVTVSKIFILSKAEIKPTLEKFMDPESIPKRYGGKLDFEWGQIPNLDDEAKKVLSSDGNDGWLRGPCLYLDHTRVVVGAENGKLRRSVPDVEKMKPIVYAADDTPEPVHRNRRSSSVTKETMREKLQAMNGTAKLDRIQSANVVPTTAQAARTEIIPAETNIVAPTQSHEHAPAPDLAEPVKAAEPATPEAPREAEPTPAIAVAPPAEERKEKPPAEEKQEASPVPAANIPAANIHKSPLGSEVNLPPPSQQPGFPQQTAEYISSSPKSTTEKFPSTLSPASAAAATATAAATAPLTNGTAHKAADTPTALSSTPQQQQAHPHPPAMPAPGPEAKHTTALNSAIADKLATGGESISVLPAEQNGAVPHPEMVVSSDRSKGLAVEREKLGERGLSDEGTEGGNGPQRPPVQRFVTAAEF